MKSVHYLLSKKGGKTIHVTYGKTYKGQNLRFGGSHRQNCLPSSAFGFCHNFMIIYALNYRFGPLGKGSNSKARLGGRLPNVRWSHLLAAARLLCIWRLPTGTEDGNGNLWAGRGDWAHLRPAKCGFAGDQLRGWV